MLLGGRIADLISAKRVVLAGLLLFTVASLVTGFAESAAVLVGAVSPRVPARRCCRRPHWPW